MIASKEIEMITKIQKEGYFYIARDNGNNCYVYAYEEEPIKTDYGYKNRLDTHWIALDKEYSNIIPPYSCFEITDFINNKIVKEYAKLEKISAVALKALEIVCREEAKEIVCLYKETGDCSRNFNCYKCLMEEKLKEADKELLSENI